VSSAAPPAELALREISGPQSLGVEPRRFWNLLWLSSVAEFKLVYAGSVLGYIWTLARPLAMFGVIYLVFSHVLGIGAGVGNYPAVLLLNLMLFQFFADASGRAVRAMVSSEGVLRKMEFPRAVVPLSVVLTSVFTFSLNMVAVLAILFATGLEPLNTWILVPLLLLAILVFTTASCFALSTLFVQFRDVAQIWTVASLALFYASPVMYPAEQIPSDFRWMLIVNPLAPIFELMRKWAVDPSAPGVLEAAGGPWGWIGPGLAFLAVCVFAWLLFRRKVRTLAELL
jgi:ABC-2 type transport system permease protein